MFAGKIRFKQKGAQRILPAEATRNNGGGGGGDRELLCRVNSQRATNKLSRQDLSETKGSANRKHPVVAT